MPPSVVVASGDCSPEDLKTLLDAYRDENAHPVELIVVLCRDRAALAANLPQAVDGIPVLLLTNPYFPHSLAITSAEWIEPARPEESELFEKRPIIGRSSQMLAIKSSIARIAPTDCNVLITGETGAGKELMAELIHQNSARRDKAFVCINCAAIPDSLLESELFGYERGAFTGAQSSSLGKLEQAQGGTVFFDEIGEMSLQSQAKLLRLIETHELQRLGARHSSRADFRIVAATNLDVESDPRFRRDLYFRLNVARIHVPPLRERKSDVPLLADFFVDHFNRLFGRRVRAIGDGAMRYLLACEWPGNIRELKNTIEACFLNLPAKADCLELPELLRRRLDESAGAPPDERQRLLEALWSTDWNKSKTARQLHWSRMTLYRKMAKYGVEARPLQRAAVVNVSASDR